MADDKEREPEDVEELIGDLEAHAADEDLPSAPGEEGTNTCTTCTCNGCSGLE
jgi:hypothetical protein